MAQVIIHFILISITCIAWGLLIYLHPIKRRQTFPTIETLILCFFSGLAIISVLSSWLSLIAPVQSRALIPFTLLILVFEIIFFRKNRNVATFKLFQNLNMWDWMFLCSGFLLLSFLSTGKPSMEDTDLYHIQNVRWINEYGTMPGLGNLYLRYGFYSNWFHAISVFKISFFTEFNFLYLNHTFSVWFFLFLFFSIQNQLRIKRKTKKTFVSILFDNSNFHVC